MKLSIPTAVRDSGIVILALLLIGSGICVKKKMLPGVHSEPSEELMYFPSGTFVRQTALGQESTLSDVAWLRAIQYYGQHRMTDRKYGMIGHIFDIVTTLDPGFIQAYVFGAMVLSQDAGRPREGLALLRKGMLRNPDDWLLAFETGFIYYTVLRDYRSAGRYFEISSSLPNAPDYTARFAAFVDERAGRTETALKLWEEVAGSTQNKYIKEMAEEKTAILRDELKKEAAARERPL